MNTFIDYATLGLVTIGTFITVYVFVRQRPHITFKVRYDVVYEREKETYKEVEQIRVTITNDLSKPIQIVEFGVKFSNGRTLATKTFHLSTETPLGNGISRIFLQSIRELKEVKSLNIKELEGTIEYVFIQDVKHEQYEKRIPRQIRQIVNE